jgi:hypothetical protein
MRKLAGAAAATAIVGSMLFLDAAVAAADEQQCPPGWIVQNARKRGDEFADKNLNGSICELNIGLNNAGNDPIFDPKGGNSNESGFVVKDDHVGP